MKDEIYAPVSAPPPLPLRRSVAIICLICILTFGTYYAYDLPATLTKDFKAIAGSESNYEFLYTAFAVPSTVTPLLVGALADTKLGPHVCTLAALVIVTVGCFMVSAGCSTSLYWIVLMGRLVMGCGGEAAFALQQTLCTWWMEPSLQPVAMSVSISAGSLGEIANFLLTKQLYSSVGFVGTNWCVTCLCAMSVAAGVLLWFLSRQRQVCKETQEDGIVTENVLSQGPAMSTQILPGDLSGKMLLQPETIEEAEINSCRELLRFEVLLLNLINASGNGAYYLFPSISADFMDEIGANGAQNLNALLFAIPMFVSPALGLALGDTSKLHLNMWLSFGCGISWIGFGFMSLQLFSPLLGFSLVAVGSSIINASLTPSLSLAVPMSLHGTAFGLWSCTQNAGIALVSVAVGVISDRSSKAVAVGFLGWVCAGALVLSVVLVFQTYVEPVEEEKDASISSLSGSSHQVEPGEQNDCTVEDQRNSFSR